MTLDLITVIDLLVFFRWRLLAHIISGTSLRRRGTPPAILLTIESTPAASPLHVLTPWRVARLGARRFQSAAIPCWARSGMRLSRRRGAFLGRVATSPLQLWFLGVFRTSAPGLHLRGGAPYGQQYRAAAAVQSGGSCAATASWRLCAAPGCRRPAAACLRCHKI